MTRAKGIDVSRWQESGIDWEVAREQDGISFAFIRASGGIRADWYFPLQMYRAGGADILCGAYHYLYPNESLEEQAAVFTIATMGLVDPRLPLMLDVEHKGLTRGHVEGFMGAGDQLNGIPVGIYTSASRWAEIAGPGYEKAGLLSLWVAHWKADEPRLPDVWDTWEFWQVSGGSPMHCAPNPVDMDYYNGTEEELREKYG